MTKLAHQSKEERKDRPMARGLLDYFPDALAEVAHCSAVGGKQHNHGGELKWDRTKSMDHADCVMRHLVDRGTKDTDGVRHSAKMAWRALAVLQMEIEADQEKPTPVTCPTFTAEELQRIEDAGDGDTIRVVNIP